MNVGLPRMHKEAGERRDFLPDFVRAPRRGGRRRIVVEEGYGSGMDISARRVPGGRAAGALRKPGRLP